MSKKYALLIGVGSYAEDSHFKPLKTPARNVAELAKTLREESRGAFEVVECVDPDLATMNEAISDLFQGKSKDEFLLLYFSGHGAQDAQRQLYFTNKKSRKYSPEELNLGTVTPANDLKNHLRQNFCHRVVLIFDCCFSGAFGEGILAMDDGSIDLEANLLNVEKSPPQQGKGRIVLTATDGMGYALEKPDEHHLSVYTRYLEEGLRTGAAGDDGAEWISAQALHHYVCDRVRDYNLKPRIFCEGDASQIYLARVCLADPELEFRKRCQKAFDSELGNFDPASRRSLRRFAALRSLSTEQVERIMAEVRQPWLDYQENLREFRETVAEQVVFYGGALPERGRRSLLILQQELEIKEEDAAEILAAVLPAPKTVRNVTVGATLAPLPEVLLPEPEDDNLSSEKGMDYRKLRDLLKAGKWKEADSETNRVMLAAVGRSDYLRKEDCWNFPCQDLKTIDRLWVKYSEGKFGFSVQKQIYVECGGKLDFSAPSSEVWQRFGDRVGWRVKGNWQSYSGLKRNPKISLDGELPSFILFVDVITGRSGIRIGRRIYEEDNSCVVIGSDPVVFFSRIEACEL